MYTYILCTYDITRRTQELQVGVHAIAQEHLVTAPHRPTCMEAVLPGCLIELPIPRWPAVPQVQPRHSCRTTERAISFCLV